MKLADLPVKEVRKLGMRDPVDDWISSLRDERRSTPQKVAVVGEIVIEKGIPLPSRKRPPKYPFDRMEVGDSFAQTFDSENAAKLGQKNLGATACVWASRNDPTRKFETRVKGCEVRIWRVK